MIPPPNLYSALGTVAVACSVAASGACGRRAAPGPDFPTSSELPAAPRRPDGVAVDPATELPPSSDAAQARTSLVVLRPPLPEKEARRLVAAFFRCIVGEDMDAMAELLTSDAVASARSRTSAPSLLEYWRGRTHHLKYHNLATQTVYSDAQVEIYRYDDLDGAAPGRPARSPAMGRSDLLVRVPIASVRAGSDRLFGDEILLVLRRDTDRFRIREAIEDFQLP